MEFEGEVISLGNADVKIKNLMRNVNAREDEIRGLKLQLGAKDSLLQAANERISKLLGEHAMAPKIANKVKKANIRAGIAKRRKKPGAPKRTFTPEQLVKLSASMAKARAKSAENRLARAASAET